MSQRQVNQRQTSLMDQLEELIPLAERAGLYDAADYLRDKVEHKRGIVSSDVREPCCGGTEYHTLSCTDPDSFA